MNKIYIPKKLIRATFPNVYRCLQGKGYRKYVPANVLPDEVIIEFINHMLIFDDPNNDRYNQCSECAYSYFIEDYGVNNIDHKYDDRIFAIILNKPSILESAEIRDYRIKKIADMAANKGRDDVLQVLSQSVRYVKYQQDRERQEKKHKHKEFMQKVKNVEKFDFSFMSCDAYKATMAMALIRQDVTSLIFDSSFNQDIPHSI